jgi:hypothetical protein
MLTSVTPPQDDVLQHHKTSSVYWFLILRIDWAVSVVLEQKSEKICSQFFKGLLLAGFSAGLVLMSTLSINDNPL